MNENIFTNQMTGKWITQSTHYSILDNVVNYNTYINYINWTYIPNYENYAQYIFSSLQTKNRIHSIFLYKVKYNQINYGIKTYYVTLLEYKFRKAYILKFDERFNLMNKFKIKNHSNNNLYLISQIDDLTILEKIYFLNTNVKIIKSVIQKNKEYIATSFSSEIRIS